MEVDLEQGSKNKASSSAGPQRKRRRLRHAQGGSSAAVAESSPLEKFEEFRATLAYFFTLFKREFTPVLEEAAREQWQHLRAEDAQVHEDGANNPLVELRIDSAFAKALFSALADDTGELPLLRVPSVPEQIANWKVRGRRAGLTSKPGWAALSEAASHLETLREAAVWYFGTGGRAAISSGGTVHIVILGASARYEYVAHHGSLGADWSDAKLISRQAAEAFAAVLVPVVGEHKLEVLLCGRDVPAVLDGHVDEVSDGQCVVRHRCQYLHDVIEEGKNAPVLSGALLVAFHGGLGLDHPELSVTWSPTLRCLASAVPTWLVVTSFNAIENEAAEGLLRKQWPSDVHIDRSGANPYGSLAGPAEIGPFDGAQGKRNYSWLCARFTARMPEECDALFG